MKTENNEYPCQPHAVMWHSSVSSDLSLSPDLKSINKKEITDQTFQILLKILSVSCL